MTYIINAIPPNGQPQKARGKSMLKIMRRNSPGHPTPLPPGEPEFGYAFSINEYVVTDLANPGLIEFELDTEPGNKPEGVDRMHIHGFCCTRGESMVPKSCRDANGVFQVDEQITTFAPGTIGVAFEPRLRAKELIDIGLIVAIFKVDETEPELILCDPQVGNGPPYKADKDGGDGKWAYPAVRLF